MIPAPYTTEHCLSMRTLLRGAEVHLGEKFITFPLRCSSLVLHESLFAVETLVREMLAILGEGRVFLTVWRGRSEAITQEHENIITDHFRDICAVTFDRE